MTATAAELQRLLAEIRACRHCVEAPEGKPLPHAPRPVLRASSTARLAVCSQAPGTKVHQSGTPFSDRSGELHWLDDRVEAGGAQSVACVETFDLGDGPNTSDRKV